MTVRTVCFITQDFSPHTVPPLPGGCSYYRCYLPMQALGIDARFGFPAWTGEHGFGVMKTKTMPEFGFDVAVIKLMMQKQVPYQIKAAQKMGQKIVVDVDDFYDDLPESNLAHKATDPTLNRHVNRDHLKRIIDAADRVTVTTPFLLDYYSNLHPDVVMVRNGVLPEQFTAKNVSKARPVFGWVGGIPWRGGDLETLSSWLPDFLEENDLMFHHSGHATSVPGAEVVPSFSDLVGIAEERMSTSPLQTIDKYHELFSFDVGVIPLNDIPFNHAKSFLKGLEYSASNIPFIAQGLPEYQYLNNSGVGRIAHTPDDWWAHATELLSYESRKRDARINRENVSRHHTIMARETDWREALLEWD